MGRPEGAGSYVAAPPSIHPSGARYRWLLSLDELPLAPLEACELPADVVEELSPTRGSYVLLWNGTPLAAVESDQAVALRLARALGIYAPLGRSFRCILHPDRRASAALWRRDEDAPFLYHDFHGRSEHWLSLALVRA